MRPDNKTYTPLADGQSNSGVMTRAEAKAMQEQIAALTKRLEAAERTAEPPRRSNASYLGDGDLDAGLLDGPYAMGGYTAPAPRVGRGRTSPGLFDSNGSDSNSCDSGESNSGVSNSGVSNSGVSDSGVSNSGESNSGESNSDGSCSNCSC